MGLRLVKARMIRDRNGEQAGATVTNKYFDIQGFAGRVHIGGWVKVRDGFAKKKCPPPPPAQPSTTHQHRLCPLSKKRSWPNQFFSGCSFSLIARFQFSFDTTIPLASNLLPGVYMCVCTKTEKEEVPSFRGCAPPFDHKQLGNERQKIKSCCH